MNLNRLFYTTYGEETVLKKLISNRASLSGILILGVMSLLAILAPYVAPYSPYAISSETYLQPSYSHLFGTDGLGRDIFSQMIWGSRLSLEVGFVSALGITSLGALVGMGSGYIGGYVDEALMRVVDVLLVIPAIAFMIFVAVILGPSVSSLLIVIIVFGWPPMARMVRSQTLSLKQRSFVETAVIGGAPRRYIIGNLIFPNVLSLVIANGILAVIYSIIAQVSLSFLGLASTSQYSWGSVLYNAEAESAIYHGGILWILMPGIFIAITGIAITLIARSMGDISDPRYSTTQR